MSPRPRILLDALAPLQADLPMGSIIKGERMEMDEGYKVD